MNNETLFFSTKGFSFKQKLQVTWWVMTEQIINLKTMKLTKLYRKAQAYIEVK